MIMGVSARKDTTNSITANHFAVVFCFAICFAYSGMQNRQVLLKLCETVDNF
jgi:hypothetical protein